MMNSSTSHNVNIYGGKFVDVQGNHNEYNVSGNMIVNEANQADLSAMSQVISGSAAYDSAERHLPCHPGTRCEILQGIRHWIDNGSHKKSARILWLHGPAGAGKTAVAQTVAEECARRGELAASFFFSRGRSKRDSIRHFIPTIAYQLGIAIPELQPFILRNFTKDPSIASKDVVVQLRQLVLEPLNSITLSASNPFMFVIDGLDECQDEDGQTMILSQLSKLANHFRFMIVSRPEPRIQHFFDQCDRHILTTISLHGTHQSRRDIETYLRSEFSKIARSLDPQEITNEILRSWPPDSAIRTLTDRSGGYFIYASTALKFIDEPSFSPIQRLDAVLDGSPSSSKAFAALDKLYTQILSTNRNRPVLKRVLGVLLTLRRQSGKFLDFSLIAEILRLSPNELSTALHGTRSLIHVDSSNPHSEIYPYHASLFDFLFDPRRAKGFYVDPKDAHVEIIRGCLSCIKTWDHPTSIFSMTFEHYALASYVYDNFVSHLRGAEGLLEAIIPVLIAMKTDVWVPTSFTGDYRFDDKDRASKILSMLTDALDFTKTQSRGAHYQALADYFTALRDTAFQRILRPKTFMERMILHAMVTLFEEVEDHEHPSKVIFRVLKIQHPTPLSSLFLHDIIFNAMHARRTDSLPKPPENANGLKEGLRDWLMDESRSRELYLDPQIVHAYLAHCCLSLLAAGQDAVGMLNRSNLVSRDPVDVYARKYWAKHLSRATPGDWRLLYQLRHTDRRFLFNEEYLTSIDVNEAQGEVDVTLILRDFHPGTPVVGARAQYTAHQCWNTIRRHDLVKAKATFKWLKRIPQPPMDLLTCWEAYCEEKDWETDMGLQTSLSEDDVLTIESNDSSYLDHFREWCHRNFGS